MNLSLLPNFSGWSVLRTQLVLRKVKGPDESELFLIPEPHSSAKEHLESSLFEAQQQNSLIEVTKGQLEVQIQTVTRAKEVIQGETPTGMGMLHSMVMWKASKAMGGYQRSCCGQAQGLRDGSLFPRSEERGERKRAEAEWELTHLWHLRGSEVPEAGTGHRAEPRRAGAGDSSQSAGPS